MKVADRDYLSGWYIEPWTRIHLAWTESHQGLHNTVSVPDDLAKEFYEAQAKYYEIQSKIRDFYNQSIGKK